MLRNLKLMLMPIAFNCYKIMYWLFNFLPVKRNKVVATTMRGRKFSDNPRFIIEKLHDLNPDLDIVWFVDDRYKYDVPSWVRAVPYYKCGMLRRIYEMATAKVWLNSHFIEFFITKKHSQLFVWTDHGSLPLKKVHFDVNPNMDKESMSYKELIKTAKCADVYLSNSDFHKEFFKRAYAFEGPVIKSGFPRNDELVKPSKDYRRIVREKLNLGKRNIFLYAPTFREKFEKTHKIDFDVYNVDYVNVHKALCEKFGGEWVILVKFHPTMQLFVNQSMFDSFPFVQDVTEYANMQELIAGSDFLLTDYSSCIIDAGIAGVSGLTLCLDFEEYKKERDVYFKMDNLPFPFARTNEKLIDNIRNFDKEKYLNKWNDFANTIGMEEPGNASETIAKKVLVFIDGKSVSWEK